MVGGDGCGDGEVKLIQTCQKWTGHQPIYMMAWYKANISIQILANEDTVEGQAETTDQSEVGRMGTMQTSQYPWLWTFSTTLGHNH